MDRTDRRQQIRETIARADHNALLDLLGDQPWPDDSLQVIGDGLLAALAAHHREAAVPAHRCAAQLTEREWEGDRLLADAITARPGARTAAPLQPVPVDLDQLAAALRADERDSPGKLNLATGDVWPPFDRDYTDFGDEDDPDGEGSWLEIRGQGSRPGYRDMEAFVVWRLADQHRADIVEAALHRPRPSTGSRTPSPNGPTCSTPGTPSARNASSDAPAPGWPMRATRENSAEADQTARASLGGIEPEPAGPWIHAQTCQGRRGNDQPTAGACDWISLSPLTGRGHAWATP